MKKLLFITALLTLGATAFGAKSRNKCNRVSKAQRVIY